jgi:hypothetical protein
MPDSLNRPEVCVTVTPENESGFAADRDVLAHHHAVLATDAARDLIDFSALLEEGRRLIGDRLTGLYWSCLAPFSAGCHFLSACSEKVA